MANIPSSATLTRVPTHISSSQGPSLKTKQTYSHIPSEVGQLSSRPHKSVTPKQLQDKPQPTPQHISPLLPLPRLLQTEKWKNIFRTESELDSGLLWSVVPTLSKAPPATARQQCSHPGLGLPTHSRATEDKAPAWLITARRSWTGPKAADRCCPREEEARTDKPWVPAGALKH